MTTLTPRLAAPLCLSLLLLPPSAPPASAQSTAAPGTVEYRLLATSKTSTMQKELNEASEAGFRFGAFMGGNTAFGGAEVVAITKRPRAVR
jgi:hypothetical protein